MVWIHVNGDARAAPARFCVDGIAQLADQGFGCLDDLDIFFQFQQDRLAEIAAQAGDLWDDRAQYPVAENPPERFAVVLGDLLRGFFVFMFDR